MRQPELFKYRIAHVLRIVVAGLEYVQNLLCNHLGHRIVAILEV